MAINFFAIAQRKSLREIRCMMIAEIEAAEIPVILGARAARGTCSRVRAQASRQTSAQARTHRHARTHAPTHPPTHSRTHAQAQWPSHTRARNCITRDAISLTTATFNGDVRNTAVILPPIRRSVRKRAIAPCARARTKTSTFARARADMPHLPLPFRCPLPTSSTEPLLAQYPSRTLPLNAFQTEASRARHGREFETLPPRPP